MISLQNFLVTLQFVSNLLSNLRNPVYSPVPSNRVGGGGGGVLIRGDPTDNLNINKRGGVQIKGVGSEKCSRSKVATRYH